MTQVKRNEKKNMVKFEERTKTFTEFLSKSAMTNDERHDIGFNFCRVMPHSPAHTENSLDRILGVFILYNVRFHFIASWYFHSFCILTSLILVFLYQFGVLRSKSFQMEVLLFDLQKETSFYREKYLMNHHLSLQSACVGVRSSTILAVWLFRFLC